MQDQPDADIAALTEAAIRTVKSPGRATFIDAHHPLPDIPRSGHTPDFDLFHFGFSICSHKVRAVLAELGLAYGSIQFAGPTQYENYTPEYLRLRLRSDAARASGYATGYSGGSSVETEGVDPAVVPTLVDHTTGTVLVDSKAICLALARRYRTPDLLPTALENAVITHLDLVDRTPHVALLYGANPDGDTRPPEIQARMPGIHQIKFDTLKRHMAASSSDPVLHAAYRAKLEKETAAEGFVVDPEAMRSAIAKAKACVSALDAALQSSSGPWVLGDTFTLADITWGISLIRLDYLGYRSFWEDEASVSAIKPYFDRVVSRPSLVTAVLNWPGSRKRVQSGV